MARVKFYLKTDNVIYVKVTDKAFTKNPIERSTGEKVMPEHWNKDKYRVSRTAPQSVRQINTQLDRIKSEVQKAFVYIKTHQLFNQAREEINRELDKLLNPGGASGNSIQSVFKEFTKFRAGQKQGAKAKFSNRTIKNYQYCFDLIRAFEGRKQKQIGDLNGNYIEQFKSHLFEEKELSVFSVRNQITIIKLLLKYAFKKRYIKDKVWENENFSVDIDSADHEKQIDSISLTDEEIDTLYNTIIRTPRSAGTQRNIDVYVLTCEIGMRYADIASLTIQDNYREIEGIPFVVKINQKTQTHVSIPLSDRAKEIIDRYKGFPYVPHNSVINRSIKHACKEAGLTKLRLSYKNVGGQWVRVEKPFFEYVHFHTARSSAITRMWRLGFNIDEIMDFTGIRSRSTVERYIKATPEEKGMRLHQKMQSLKSAGAIIRKIG